MTKTRLIATDIDGTMIRSDGSLSPRVRAAMHSAVEAGIHVVPATGRPAIIAQDVIEASGLASYWVFANGAITKHLGRDELVRGFFIDADVTFGLLGRLREALPKVGFAVEFEHSIAYESGFLQVVPMGPPVPPIEDVRQVLKDHSTDVEGRGRIQKLLVFQPGENIETLYEQVTEVAGDHAAASYSGLSFIELAADNVTKATALGLLADDLGIEVDEVSAFGDNHNDIAMLEWAGSSYAMANATADAKAAADFVIDSNDEDGLAVAIEGLLSGHC